MVGLVVIAHVAHEKRFFTEVRGRAPSLDKEGLGEIYAGHVVYAMALPPSPKKKAQSREI